MSRPSDKNPAVGRSAKALPLLGLVSVALAGTAALLNHRLGDERDRSASLQGRLDRLQSENSALLAYIQRQGASGVPRPGMGARSPESPPSANGSDALLAQAGASAPPDGATPRRGEDPRSGLGPGATGSPPGIKTDRASALQDGATRDALRRQQAAALRRRYPDLAEALGLSRENADRFIDALVEQQMRRVDESLRLAGSGTVGSSVEMKEAGQRLAAASRDADQALAAQFGPEVLQGWKDYQQGLGVRMDLRGLQLELDDAGMALTLGQRDDLVAAMLREQQAVAGAGSKKLSAEARAAQAEASYQRLQATARGILSAEQFARFDARQRQRLQITRAAAGAAATRDTSP